MAETNRFQLVVAQETQPGAQVAAGTLFTAANAKIVPTTAPQIALNPELIRRDAVRPSLTPLTPLTGATLATVTFSVEVAGDSAAAFPAWGILMEACGLKRYPIQSYTAGTITGGPFYCGETITGATSGSAKCLFDTFNGQAKLYTFDESAQIVGTGTGGTSGATFTPADYDGTDVGQAWVPVDSPESTVTIGSTSGSILAGDVLTGDTSGARIVALENWTDGAARRFRYLSGTLTDAEDLTNTSRTGATTLTTGTIAQTKYPTLTIAVIEDSVRRVLYGCRGRVSVNVQSVGEPVTATFEFTGIPAAETDGVAISGVTRTNHVPPGFRGVTFLVGDDADTYATEHTPRVQAFGISVEGNIGVSRDATTSTGLSGAAAIRSRQVTANMTVGVQAEGLFDWLAKTRSSTPIRVNCILPSTKSDNSWWFHLPAFTPTAAAGQDDNGDALRAISGELSGRRPDGSEGDDREFVVAVFDADPS